MDELTLKFIVPGKPIAKKRPRFVRRGKFVGAYNEQETEEGKFMILCQQQMKGKGPIPAPFGIHLACRFYMPIPRSWTKKQRDNFENDGIDHVKKPDVDNLVKFVKDCLNGIAWHDDSQVVTLSAEKYYDDVPRTVIDIEW